MTFFSGTQKKNLRNVLTEFVQIVKVNVIQNNNIDWYNCIAKKNK